MADSIKSPIDFSHFEIVKQGNVNFPTVSGVGGGAGNFDVGEAITTIAHGLGFTPVVLAFVQELGIAITDNYLIPSIALIGGGSTTGIWSTLTVATDSTNLYIINDLMTYGTSGSTLNGAGYQCQYYLLKEKVKRTS